MKETKRKVKAKGAQSSRPKAAAATNCKQLRNSNSKEEEAPVPAAVLMAAEPAATANLNLRAVMNAYGAGLLGHLGQQMNAHLNSLAVLESASRTLTFQCRNMAMEIGKLTEVLEQYQGAHADALVQATLLRRLVAEFAQHVYNSHALGITNQ